MYIPETSPFGNPVINPRPLEKQPVRLLLSSGVSFLIRKDFHQVDELFDLFFAHYSTDVDLSLRANVLGYWTVFVPTAVVYHIDDNKVRLSFNLLKRYFIGSRDRLLAFYKSMNRLEYALALPILLIGIPQKALVMRSSVPAWIRLALSVVTFFLSPLVFAAALLKTPCFYEKRNRILAARQAEQFWILKSLMQPCIASL
jgi:GT2 family glycosyltransferase